MGDYRVIEVKQSVFAENRREAEALRERLRKRGTLLVNIMSSPGSGKTTVLERTIEALSGEFKLAVMEADIDGEFDARTIEAKGVRTIQLHTGGMCHLDAAMTEQGLEALGADDADIIFLENIGNLVCPAEFDTGASVNVTILSVPEGDDKPAKYPLMYQVCALVLVNKTDVLPYFDFSLERLRDDVMLCNPGAEVHPVCAKTGEGMEAWYDWLRERVAIWKSGR